MNIRPRAFARLSAALKTEPRWRALDASVFNQVVWEAADELAAALYTCDVSNDARLDPYVTMLAADMENYLAAHLRPPTARRLDVMSRWVVEAVQREKEEAFS